MRYKYKSCIFLLKDLIFFNKKFYLTLLLKVPLSIVVPLFFLSNYLDTENYIMNGIIFNSLLWQALSSSVIEVFMFVKSELENKSDLYIRLSGENVTRYYGRCSILISLFFWIIYNCLIIICLSMLSSDIMFYMILSILYLPLIFISNIVIVIITLNNSKVFFNFINMMLDFLFLFSGVLYPLEILPLYIKNIALLIPTSWIFQSSLGGRFLEFDKMNLIGTLLVIGVFLMFLIKKKEMKA